MAFLNNYKIELLNQIGITPLWKWNNPYNEQNTETIFELANTQQNSHKNSKQISNQNINVKKITENTESNDNKNNVANEVNKINENSNVVLTIKNHNNYSWETLTKQILQCNNCELAKTRNNSVVGVGNKNSDWLFIGEAPGLEEDKRGEPFVGDSGKLLDNILKHLQLSRNSNIYIANTVKCRPPFNRDPTQEEIEKCNAFLLQQISLIQPKIIVCLGKVAFFTLFKTQLDLPQNFKISAYRKKMLNLTYKYEKQLYKIPSFITYHPSYLLRSPLQKVETWKDLCLAKHYFETHLT